MIGNVFNYDEVFFRDLTVCVLATLEDKLYWVNRFSNGNIDVSVDMYYSLSGNADYLLDAFTDDVLGEGRNIELNTDKYPRGHITLTSWRYLSEEFANPNVIIKVAKEDDEGYTKNILSKIRAIPIEASYTVSILLNSELDAFKCSQVLMTNLLFFKYMYFEFNFLRISALLSMPDDTEFKINREITMEESSEKSLDFTITVRTYYPAFNQDQEIGKPKKSKWFNQIRTLE